MQTHLMVRLLKLVSYNAYPIKTLDSPTLEFIYTFIKYNIRFCGIHLCKCVKFTIELVYCIHTGLKSVSVKNHQNRSENNR